MGKVSLEEKLLLEFNLPDFIVKGELAAEFKFRPDILLKNETTARAFIVRKTHAIPFDFIDRFSEQANIENCTVERYIAFANKPSDATIQKCVTEKRIAVCYTYQGKIKTILPAGGFAAQIAVVAANPPYEMPSTHIFFSSVEELPERKLGEKVVESINKYHKKSIWANRIERDKMLKTMTRQELWKLIFASIEKDEFFLGILSEEFSSGVESEIQFAMQYKSYENIILLVKDTPETTKAWHALLTDVEIRYHTRGKTVWYKKYDDEIDFEGAFHAEVLELISKKYKENGSTFL